MIYKNVFPNKKERVIRALSIGYPIPKHPKL